MKCWRQPKKRVAVKKKVFKYTYHISSIKRVTRKFQEVLRRAKQRQKNVQKKFAGHAKLLFHCSRCLRRLAFDDYIFCLSKLLIL